MPNGMLEKALLPGWAPDAMQLIHFYSWEQVSRASQAASLKTALFIWPQALEKSEGIGRDSMPTSSRNTLRVPHGAVVQHLTPLHGCIARFSPVQQGGLRVQPQHRLAPPGQGHGAIGMPTPSSRSSELVPLAPTAASCRLYGLTCTCIK